MITIKSFINLLESKKDIKLYHNTPISFCSFLIIENDMFVSFTPGINVALINPVVKWSIKLIGLYIHIMKCVDFIVCRCLFLLCF